MTVILAAVDDSDAAGPVLATAQAVADLLHGSLRAIHVREQVPAMAGAAAVRAAVALEELEGEPIDAIVHAAGEPDIALVVIGARGTPEGPRPCGHIAMAVAEQVDKPVLVVPPNGIRDASAPIQRVLVPLEGTEASTDAMTAHLHDLAEAGVDLMALHVFDAASVPAFWDQPAYAEENFATEFAARWCTEPDVEVRLRRGPAGDAVVEVAEAEEADVIALGWSRNLAPGRALVVRSVLERARIPVLLVPVPPG